MLLSVVGQASLQRGYSYATSVQEICVCCAVNAVTYVYIYSFVHIYICKHVCNYLSEICKYLLLLKVLTLCFDILPFRINV